MKSRRDICTPHVHCNLMYNSQSMGIPWMSTWMHKEDALCLCAVEYYTATKEGNHYICDNMDETWWHDAEWNESFGKKNKYYIISFICGILKKRRLIGKETTLVVARGRSGWRWGKQVKVVKSYKPSIIIKFWGCNIQYGDYNTSVLYIQIYQKSRS